MTLLELNKTLEKTGYPVAFRAFPRNSEISLPRICYQTPKANNFYADGEAYFTATTISIELYAIEKDIEAEKKTEAVLKELPWSKDEVYLTEEKLYLVEYEVEI